MAPYNALRAPPEYKAAWLDLQFQSIQRALVAASQYPEFYPQDWGSRKGDNAAVADAIKRAQVLGGVVKLPPGVGFANIVLPAGQAGSSPLVHVRGSGLEATIVQSPSPNTPVLRVVGLGVVDGAAMGDFTIQPFATDGVGSGMGVDLCGMRACVLRNIGYKDNGTGYYEQGFDFSSFRPVSALNPAGGPAPVCYGNLLNHPVAESTTYGPKTFINFSNGGTNDWNYDANNNRIHQAWCYLCAGTLRGIDALKSNRTTLDFAELEACSLMTAVRLGFATDVSRCWIEANAVDIEYTNGGADGTSQRSVVSRNFFAQAHAIVVPAGCSGNVWEDNYEFLPISITDLSGSLTRRDSNLMWLGGKKVLGVQGAAIPDTAGATLAALETELNKVKAALRAGTGHGLIA